MRVSDEHAGKNAKCPSCSVLNTIPASANYDPIGSGLSESGTTFSSEEQKPISPVPNSFNSPIGTGPNPYQPGSVFPGVQRFSHFPPHRGGFVLTLGLISTIGNILLCCTFPLLGVGMMVPGIFAWIMGTNDLKKMHLGAMDASGRSTTQTGVAFGIVGVVFAVLQIVFGIVMLVIFLSMDAAGV